MHESLGKDMSVLPDSPKLVIALTAKYQREVDKIAGP